MNLKDEIERLAHELSKRKRNADGSELENWLEAERIVAAWLKKRQEAEDSTDKGKQKPAV